MIGIGNIKAASFTGTYKIEENGKSSTFKTDQDDDTKSLRSACTQIGSIQEKYAFKTLDTSKFDEFSQTGRVEIETQRGAKINITIGDEVQIVRSNNGKTETHIISAKEKQNKWLTWDLNNLVQTLTYLTKNYADDVERKKHPTYIKHLEETV